MHKALPLICFPRLPLLVSHTLLILQILNSNFIRQFAFNTFCTSLNLFTLNLFFCIFHEVMWLKNVTASTNLE